MKNRNSGLWALPLGLVLGGLIGTAVGIAIEDITLWMILGAGGGLVIGLAVRTAIANRRGGKEEPQ
jgi:hypothetical protein